MSDSPSDSGSDFGEDEDPDKIEVPGEWLFIQFFFFFVFGTL